MQAKNESAWDRLPADMAARGAMDGLAAVFPVDLSGAPRRHGQRREGRRRHQVHPTSGSSGACGGRVPGLSGASRRDVACLEQAGHEFNEIAGAEAMVELVDKDVVPRVPAGAG